LDTATKAAIIPKVRVIFVTGEYKTHARNPVHLFSDIKSLRLCLNFFWLGTQVSHIKSEGTCSKPFRKIHSKHNTMQTLSFLARSFTVVVLLAACLPAVASPMPQAGVFKPGLEARTAESSVRD